MNNDQPYAVYVHLVPPPQKTYRVKRQGDSYMYLYINHRNRG